MTDDHLLGETMHKPRVVEVRGAWVILDSDLARMFGVEVRRLNEQVRRNQAKFDGFAFRLTREDTPILMSQIATSSSGHGGRRKLPYVFTEHGVVMAATVLQSDQAIAASRFIIKVFVEARRKLLVSDGANLPSLIDARGLLPLESEARTGLTSKLNGALGRVLDASRACWRRSGILSAPSLESLW